MKKILAVLLAAILLTTMLPVSEVHSAAKTAKQYLADGNKFLAQKKYQDALKSFDAAIKLNSKYTEAYVGKGQALAGQEKYQDAIKAYDSAIAINKKYAPAYYFKGKSLFEIDRYDEAIKAYDTAIANNAKYAEAYNDKGFVLYWQDKYDDALKCYDTAIKLNSKLVDAYVNKAALLYEHYEKYDEANKVIDAALKLNGNHEDALYYKAEILQALNNHVLAITYYDKVLKINAKDAYAYSGKGYSQYMLKKYADALISFNKAIELFPKLTPINTHFYYNRSLTYSALGKYDLAIKDIKDLISYDSTYAEVLFGYNDGNEYYNEYLNMEIPMPANWYAADTGLGSLADDLRGVSSSQIPDSSFPVMVSKYPIGTVTAFNPNLVVTLENVSAHPEIKTGKDYLPYVQQSMNQQLVYEYDPNIQTVVLDSISFDVLNCKTNLNGVETKQKIYGTIYKGFAVCFVLSYSTEADLLELENLIKTVKFYR